MGAELTQTPPCTLFLERPGLGWAGHTEQWGWAHQVSDTRAGALLSWWNCWLLAWVGGTGQGF